MNSTQLKIKIIKEPTNENPFIVIYKPSGLPSAPLTENDKKNALIQTSFIYPEILKVSGKKEIEHGLLHRIDTPTDGLIIIATTQKSYDNLQKLQKEGKILKTYKAICELDSKNAEKLGGFPIGNFPKICENQNINISSHFRSFGEGHKSVRPVTDNSGEAALKKIGKKIIYNTDVFISSINKNLVNVECNIQNGFRHQVRCHLAWLGLPIIGDPIYNTNKNGDFNFTASKINIDGLVYQLKP